jgi:hypothetical protein
MVTYPVFEDDTQYIRGVDIDTRSLLVEIPADQSPVFNNEGTRYAIANTDGTWQSVTVHDISSGQETVLSVSVQGYSKMELLALSDDGTHVLVYVYEEDLYGQLMLINEDESFLLQTVYGKPKMQAVFASDSYSVAWSYDEGIYAATEDGGGESLYIAHGVNPRWIEDTDE